MTFKIYRHQIKILADLHTPVSVYCKLRDVYHNTLLLESADYHDKTNNKSFICIDPLANFEAVGLNYTSQLPGSDAKSASVKEPKEVMNAFRNFYNSFEMEESDELIKTTGLWGYHSFESVQYMDTIKFFKDADEIKSNPDLKYQFFRFVIVFDHFKKEMYLVEHSLNKKSDSNEALLSLWKIIESNNLSLFDFKTEGAEYSNITDDDYKAMVKRGIHHCQIGDCFQVVLSREFRQKFRGDDFGLYRYLRSMNPSPYLFYFDYSDFKILGSSPELQVQIENNIASINPIAGTARRGENQKEDKIIAEKLLKDPKEKSEHVMLLDLARNDLSKYCDNVEVESNSEIQLFAQVIHMVSKVSGELMNGYDGIDVFNGSFPAGTLSGAPKYRAMEIISENEKLPRNFYGGSVGFIGFDGSVNHAIIIRSVLSKHNTLVYQAGAGIVHQSTEEGELQEVNNKLRAIRNAIKKASEK